jgi:cystathionine beta-lyase/cystathionine gamma-synthase
VFATQSNGKADPMTDSDKETTKKTAAASAASKARQNTDKATAPATNTARAAAAKTDEAASAAKTGAQRAADATSTAAQTAVKSVEVGRQAIVSASGQVAAGAKTAWVVLNNRKLVAAGLGAGLTALSAASFVAGRRTERHTHGPVTRLTGGRI